jgi:hypothetical protein
VARSRAPPARLIGEFGECAVSDDGRGLRTILPAKIEPLFSLVPRQNRPVGRGLLLQAFLALKGSSKQPFAMPEVAPA